jgi:hypothetical protein
VYFQELKDAKEKFDLALAAATKKEVDENLAAEKTSRVQLELLSDEHSKKLEKTKTTCIGKVQELMKEKTIVKKLQAKLSELKILMSMPVKTAEQMEAEDAAAMKYMKEHPDEKFDPKKFINLN